MGTGICLERPSIGNLSAKLSGCRIKQAIDEVIEGVLERREAKHDDPVHANERHEHTNREFQDFCNNSLLPLFMEARQALVAHHIPAEVKANPEIGFTTSNGVVLVIATREFSGTNLLGSTNRVFVLVELDVDDLSLSLQVGGDNIILSQFPVQHLPISECSLSEIKHTIKEVVREAATIFFKV